MVRKIASAAVPTMSAVTVRVALPCSRMLPTASGPVVVGSIRLPGSAIAGPASSEVATITIAEYTRPDQYMRSASQPAGRRVYRSPVRNTMKHGSRRIVTRLRVRTFHAGGGPE